MNATTTMSYVGEVSIKMYGKRKARQFNKGTDHLFNAVHQSLARNLLTGASKDNYILGYLPCEFLLINNNSEVDVSDKVTKSIRDSSITLSPVEITQRYASPSSAKFVGLLNSSNLVGSKLEGVSHVRALLVTSHKEPDQYVLAYTDLDAELFRTIVGEDSVTKQAEIEWLLQFSNNNTKEV